MLLADASSEYVALTHYFDASAELIDASIGFVLMPSIVAEQSKKSKQKNRGQKNKPAWLHFLSPIFLLLVIVTVGIMT